MAAFKCPDCGKALNVRGFCPWCGWSPIQGKRYEYPSEISDPEMKRILEKLVSEGLIYVSLKWDGEKNVEVYKPIKRARGGFNLKEYLSHGMGARAKVEW